MCQETPASTAKLHILAFKVMITVVEEAYHAVLLLFLTKTKTFKSGYKAGIK